MYDRFLILNANIGDVLYMRIDGKVNAVKLVKILCGRPNASASHDATYAWFLIAGEGGEPKMLYVGFSATKKFYRTIEDCIKSRVHKEYMNSDKDDEDYEETEWEESDSCWGFYGELDDVIPSMFDTTNLRQSEMEEENV